MDCYATWNATANLNGALVKQRCKLFVVAIFCWPEYPEHGVE